MKVGRYFDSREFGAVSVEHLAGLGALCALFLDPIRARYGVTTIHSGRRTEERNRAVNGALDSRHLYHRFPLECAADITCAKGTPHEVALYARSLARLYGRGGVGEYRGHAHVDVGPLRVWTG